MVWYDNLYVGEMVRGRKERIMKRIESHGAEPCHYLITLAENEHEQLDLFSTAFLTEKRKRTIPLVVGLAGSKREAVFLVKKMTEDCVANRGDVNLRAFFTSNEKR